MKYAKTPYKLHREEEKKNRRINIYMALIAITFIALQYISGHFIGLYS